jgi:hypothetical protein
MLWIRSADPDTAFYLSLRIRIQRAKSMRISDLDPVQTFPSKKGRIFYMKNYTVYNTVYFM